VLILCCHMFCYVCMFDLVVLDLVFICNGLVCIFVFFKCWLRSFWFCVTNLVLLGLHVFFSVPSQEIGWEERLRNDLPCVEWDVKP